MSNKAIFEPPKPIRGGIPICFPQFNSHGILEARGFAKNRVWSVDPNPPPFPTNSVHRAYVDLLLKPSEDDLKLWPHSFEFRLRVTLGPGGDLMLTSRIKNVDSKSFSFTFSYQTYFSVSDISEVRLEGLESLDYLDNMKNSKRFTEEGDAIRFEGEIDKIYLSTPAKIAILDQEKKRTFTILKDGLPDAVVWNPWDKEDKALSDFGDDEYRQMLCVEAAAVEKPVTLSPGEEWTGTQELSAVLLSCIGPLDPEEMQPQPQKMKRKKPRAARLIGKKKQRRSEKKLENKAAKERFHRGLNLEAQSDGDSVTWKDILNAETEEKGDAGDTGIWEQEFVPEPVDVGHSGDSLEHSTSSAEGYYSSGSD